MIPWKLILSNSKTILIVLGIVVALWYYRDAEDAKKERDRVQQNAEQIRKADSIGYSEVILTKEEMIEDLKYNNPDLVKRLDAQDIQLKRIKSIISQKQTYTNIDTTTFLLNKILSGIKKGESAEQKVVDSTDCHVVEAMLHFNGKDLKMDVTKVGFVSESSIVAHTEKVGLRFWKWFRKKKVTITVLNSCGKSETHLINVGKK